MGSRVSRLPGTQGLGATGTHSGAVKAGSGGLLAPAPARRSGGGEGAGQRQRKGSRGPGGGTPPSTHHLQGDQLPCPRDAPLSKAVRHLPMGTAVSALVPEPVRKSPSSVGLSYTHAGKTGRRCPEFLLFCLSRSNFLVSSRDWGEVFKDRKKTHTFSTNT